MKAYAPLISTCGNKRDRKDEDTIIQYESKAEGVDETTTDIS